VLGTGAESDVFWEKMMLPLMSSKFKVELELPKRRFVAVHMPQLLNAIKHHCGVELENSTAYDFRSEHPVSEKQINTVHTKVKWLPNEQVEAFSIAARAEQFIENGEYAKALQALNLRLSLNNAIYTWDPDQQKQAKILIQVRRSEGVQGKGSISNTLSPLLPADRGQLLQGEGVQGGHRRGEQGPAAGVGPVHALRAGEPRAHEAHRHHAQARQHESHVLQQRHCDAAAHRGGHPLGRVHARHVV
jgi:hypothetical protein